MTSFITAKLIKNEPGAEYEGNVFNRFLSVQHPSGKVLTLFDHDLIGDHLQVGEDYEFVIVHLFYTEAAVAPPVQPDLPWDVWIGEVLDLQWNFEVESDPIERPAKEYTVIRTSPGREHMPETKKRRMLVRTPFGAILLSAKDIARTAKAQPEVGDWLMWSANSGRYDLLGFRRVSPAK